MRGALITLEGIDGTGKSTIGRMLAQQLAELLAEQLAERLKYRDVVLTAEPTKGDVGMILRKRLEDTTLETTGPKLFEELFLFMADHADHLSRLVVPSLERGAIVISDRYSDSTSAYQGATLKGLVPDPISWIRSIHQPWNVTPDLTLLFTLKPEIAVRRIAARDGTVAKFEREDFLRQVDDNFMAMSKIEPQRFVLVDASGDIDSVAEKAMFEVMKFMRENEVHEKEI